MKRQTLPQKSIEWKWRPNILFYLEFVLFIINIWVHFHKFPLELINIKLIIKWIEEKNSNTSINPFVIRVKLPNSDEVKYFSLSSWPRNPVGSSKPKEIKAEIHSMIWIKYSKIKYSIYTSNFEDHSCDIMFHKVGSQFKRISSNNLIDI